MKRVDYLLARPTTQHELEAQLQRLGDEGWQLVVAQPDPHEEAGLLWRMIFKRQRGVTERRIEGRDALEVYVSGGAYVCIRQEDAGDYENIVAIEPRDVPQVIRWLEECLDELERGHSPPNLRLERPRGSET